jgi:hypothetical protein
MVIRRISDESIETLRRLIGVSVHTIWCPNLDAAGAHLAAWTLAMLIEKGRFFNFSCEWSETPIYLNDSWMIEVFEASGPANILKNNEGAYLNVCSISMWRAQPIEQIEIFEYQTETDKEHPEETTLYDQALVFRCAGGRSFCICCLLNGPGIATYLHFSEDPAVVEEMTSGSKVRLVLA